MPRIVPLPVRTPGQASPTARHALWVYAVLAVYASLHPFTGWRSPGLPFWSFALVDWPSRWLFFDTLTNLVAYLPFGVFAVLAQPARWPRWIVLLLAVLLGAALSFAIESIQAFLPTRVSDLRDFISNTAGTALGALLALPFSRWWLSGPGLRRWREQGLHAQATPVLILIGLWLVAQLQPSAAPFATGRIVPLALGLIGDLLGIPMGSGWFDTRQGLSADQFSLLESLSGGLALLALACVWRTALNASGPRTAWMLALLPLALLAKSFANALQYGPDQALSWWTDGARSAVLVAAVMALLIARLPSWAATLAALLLLALQLALVNAVPDNPYFAAGRERWHEGRFISFFGVSQWVAALWPLLAMIVLSLRGWRRD